MPARDAGKRGGSFKPGLSDRMSRSEMALLLCVFPTASQVLTTDTKRICSKTNMFNLLADDDFQAAAGAFLPTT